MADKIGDDLMIGTKTIAAELGLSRRQVFYLLEEQKIPGFKIGARWAASRASLKAFMSDLERAGRAVA